MKVVPSKDTEVIVPTSNYPSSVHGSGPLCDKPLARVVIIATVPKTIRAFLKRQIHDLRDAGFDVQAISSPEPDIDICGTEFGISFHPISMQRKISPFRDSVAAWKIARKLRSMKPDVVQTFTPKAGLLGMIGAFASGVPVRIYTVNGFVWETALGWRRHLLRFADRASAFLATRVLCVSHYLRNVLLANGIADSERVVVLGKGSLGVDIRKFDPQRFSSDQRRHARTSRGLPAHELVLGFVGRLVPDKGIETLFESWRFIRDQFPGAVLFLVGEREPSHPLPETLWSEITADPRIVIASAAPDQMPESYSTMDVLILPTLREGLGQVLLEAGAMEIPVIATRDTGCIDVVLEGITGSLIRARNPGELSKAIADMAGSSQHRRELGKAARRYVTANFSADIVSAMILDEYRRLLSECGRL